MDALFEAVAADLERGGSANEAIARYYHDPVGFARDCIKWPAGKGLTSYQQEILGELPVRKRVAVRGPHGLGKCVQADESLRLADGSLVRAADLIGTGFDVLAVDPDSGRIASARAFASDNGVVPVVRLTTDKNRVIVRTLNHPLWGDLDPKGHPAPEGRGRVRPEPSWVAAGDLQPGSVIATYLGNEGATVQGDEAELTLLGALLTDGCLTGSSVKFAQAPGPMLDAVATAARQFRCELRGRGNYDYLIAKPAGQRNNPVMDLCRRWGIAGHSAHTKQMPALVWTLDDKSLGLLLNRMFACDGWVTSGPRPRNRTNREVGYVSASLGLATDVQRALLRLGIVAELRPRSASWTHKGVTQRGRYYGVAIHDVAGIRLFAERVGVLGKEAALADLVASCDEASSKEQHRWRSHNLPAGFAWERVRTVEVLDPAPTVAITVPGPETFVTDFVEHNTACVSLAVLWFALTRDSVGKDWKCITTAGVWRQLQHFTWPEIHKWTRLVDWEKLGRDPLTNRNGLQILAIKLRTGNAFAVASDNPGLIEGAHADSILYIFDESKMISGALFDAAEGALSGAGQDTSSEAYALAMSTPGEPAGRFYEIHARRPGLDDWWTRHVTKAEAIAAGRVSADWCEQRRVQWGADSAVYANRVEGEFHSSDEDSVIPLGWIELANERWRAWDEAGRPEQDGIKVLGVDVARSGSDKTAMAIRHGKVLTEIRYTTREDTMVTVGRAKGILHANPGMTAVVDVIGIGAGVVDRLRELRLPVEGFNASEGTRRMDASGELGFVNCRSAALWSLREQLDPAYGHDIALPPDDLLTGDLTAPHWRVMSGGKIQVESKDDIRSRISRSTDAGDAVADAFWPLAQNWAEAFGVVYCFHCGRPFMAEVHPDRCPHCRTSRTPVAA